MAFAKYRLVPAPSRVDREHPYCAHSRFRRASRRSVTRTRRREARRKRRQVSLADNVAMAEVFVRRRYENGGVANWPTCETGRVTVGKFHDFVV